MAYEAYLAEPNAPPAFEIPNSSSTVEVRVIDTGADLLIKSKLFWRPSLRKFNGVHAPSYCFLLSHRTSSITKHVLFDLGLRQDWRTYAPKIVKLISATTKIDSGPDVATVLDSDTSELGVRSVDISSVIWSHNHFDHTGDPSTFPSTTELVVGPGVKAASWPGWPTDPNGGVLDSDAEGRAVREISFDTGLKIGRFDAFDFFGDGSFYLLDAPGHAVGHMCGLARTTSNPPSFIFMGADACHHPGLLRPTRYLPLPRSICPSPFVEQNGYSQLSADGIGCCPGELVQQLTSEQQPDSPFFTIAKGPYLLDHTAAMDTITKIHELDSRDEIFVLIGHDLSLRDRIPLFPEKINSWRSEFLKTDTRWLFCNDFRKSLRKRTSLKSTFRSLMDWLLSALCLKPYRSSYRRLEI